MKKPKAPKKPSKYENPPSKTKTTRTIFVKKNGTVGLVNEKDYFLEDEKFSFYIDWDKLSEAGYEYSLEKDLTYSNISKIHEQLNCDFEITSSVNEDGYFEYWIIAYKGENLEYEKQLKEYKNRFKIYDSKYKEYLTEMKKYYEFKKEEKIEKLKKELAKYE